MSYIAVDIGGTMIKYGVVIEEKHILEHDQTPTHATDGGYAIVEQVISIAQQLIMKYDQQIKGIAIATAGQINPYTTEVIYASDAIPAYKGLNIAKLVQEKINLPVSVENDVNCALLAELDPDEKGITTLFTIGTGIGGAVAIDNRIIHGTSFSAGEMGYLPMLGRTFQELASTRSLIHSVETYLGRKGLSGQEVFEISKINNDVFNIIDEFYDRLAQGLSAPILLLCCKTIYLGGAIVNQERFIEQVRNKLSHYIPTHILTEVDIKRTKNKNHSGMLGAVEWFKQSQAITHS